MEEQKLLEAVNHQLTLEQTYKGWLLEIHPKFLNLASLKFNGHHIGNFFLFEDSSCKDLTDVDQLLFEVSNLIDACLKFNRVI